MPLERISSDQFQQFLESNDQRAVVILQPDSGDLDSDPGFTTFLELAERLSLSVQIYETPTPFGLVQVQPFIGESTMSIPVVPQLDNWNLPIRILESIEDQDDVEPIFVQGRGEVLRSVSGLLVREENWYVGCWMTVKTSPEEFRHLNFVVSDDERGYLLLFKDWLKASVPNSPEVEVHQFGPGTMMEISPNPDNSSERIILFARNATELSFTIHENHIPLITECCDSLGWDYEVVQRLEILDLVDSGETLADFSGSGNTRTKPFVIPSNVEYFSYTWTAQDPDFVLSLHDLNDPASWVDYHAYEPSGNTNYFGSGKYFFSVEGKGEWQIRVYVDDDARKSETNNDVTEIDNFNFVFWHMRIDDFVMMTPTNVNTQFNDYLRQSSGVNFIEDLSRGFVFSPDASIRNTLAPKHVSAVAEGIRTLDGLYRSFFPPCDVDPSTGLMSFNRPIDGSAAQRHFKNLWKTRVAVSKALAKAGLPNGAYLFSTARSGSAPFYIFECSTSEIAQQRQATAQQWAGIAAQIENQNAPRRAAEAWFDEGHRRGHF